MFSDQFIFYFHYSFHFYYSTQEGIFFLIRNELNEQKDSMNQLMENRLDLLTKTVEKQRKRKRMRQDENDESGESEASSVYLEAEKLKVVVSDICYSLLIFLSNVF